MKDRTALSEPLTIGQRIVAKWEGPISDWSEPADLADAIDAAIAAEREDCARIADQWGQREALLNDDCFVPSADYGERLASSGIADRIRNRK